MQSIEAFEKKVIELQMLETGSVSDTDFQQAKAHSKEIFH
jgi:hypothetical protein